MSFNETHEQVILRRARESLEAKRQIADQARAALKIANDDVTRAKEKYDALFLANENKERAKLLSVYSHTTN